jgi:hypothetical protein
MHAKRTRDRKKMFLEVSEQIISDMESESRILRDYLVSLRLMTQDEASKAEERTNDSKRELAVLKVCIYVWKLW